MTTDEFIHAIKKGLEAWTLQNVCDGAIILTFVALALIAGRGYFESLKDRLSLRVAVEAWETAADLAADMVLAVIALVGLFLVNPDIMADIKIAVPWVPVGFLLMSIALVIRAFYGGRRIGSRSWGLSLGLIFGGTVLSWFGFTFIMEAATRGYLDKHPSAIWEAMRSMRSDLNPELAMTTFLVVGTALMLVFLWAAVAGVINTLRTFKRSESDPSDE